MNMGARRILDQDFEGIRTDLVAMSVRVGLAIEEAMQALKEHDQPLAAEIIAKDEEINQLRFHIEEACITLIATQQPIATDLRTVVAAIHLAVEMERMADHAAGIAKTVTLMDNEPFRKTVRKILKMGELCHSMLGESMQAFLARDTEKAREIAARDAEMDGLYREVFDRLVETMAKRPEVVAHATYLMWAAHNLERIADRVTNIAERIIFITTGSMQELKP